MQVNQLPVDLIPAATAARLASTHLATIHRWVLDGALRGWKRPGSRKGERKRLYVSRGELEAMFEPVEPGGQEAEVAPPKRRGGRRPASEPSWIADELRKGGVE